MRSVKKLLPATLATALIAVVAAAFVLGSSALHASSVSPAQNPPPAQDAQQGPVIRSQVNLVNIFATVRDHSKRIVTDLKQQDFKIQEDGQPQRTTSFEEPGGHSLKSDATINSTADLDREAPETPVNLIVLDEINTRFEDMAFARYSLKKYLDAQPAIDERKIRAAADLAAQMLARPRAISFCITPVDARNGDLRPGRWIVLSAFAGRVGREIGVARAGR